MEWLYLPLCLLAGICIAAMIGKAINAVNDYLDWMSLTPEHRAALLAHEQAEKQAKKRKNIVRRRTAER